jgi:hypothetical protein
VQASQYPVRLLLEHAISDTSDLLRQRLCLRTYRGVDHSVDKYSAGGSPGYTLVTIACKRRDFGLCLAVGVAIVVVCLVDTPGLEEGNPQTADQGIGLAVPGSIEENQCDIQCLK